MNDLVICVCTVDKSTDPPRYVYETFDEVQAYQVTEYGAFVLSRSYKAGVQTKQLPFMVFAPGAWLSFEIDSTKALERAQSQPASGVHIQDRKDFLRSPSGEKP